MGGWSGQYKKAINNYFSNVINFAILAYESHKHTYKSKGTLAIVLEEGINIPSSVFLILTRNGNIPCFNVLKTQHESDHKKREIFPFDIRKKKNRKRLTIKVW